MDSLDLNKDMQHQSETPESISEKVEETLEQPVVEKTSEQEVSQEEPQAQGKPHTPTKEELIAEFRKLLELQVDEIKEKAEGLKQSFYKIYHAELEAQKKAFVEAGNVIEDFVPVTDEMEQQFKGLLADYKKRKSEENARLEKEKAQNQLQKEHIIDQMKSLVESDADVSSNIAQFRELQQTWKTVGAVPTGVANELWKKYNLYQEQFYDLVKINNELREYDFKKNLEVKTQLCEAAEKLTEVPDVVAAFRSLQKLHEEWANTGPVARDLREDLWNRFKAASTAVNKRHQDFFVQLHQQEDENLRQKTALCERLETIDIEKLTTFKQWEKASQEVMDVQAQWRQIGFAPRKSNQQIYDRYRTMCDNFFSKKTAYYKQIKGELTENLEKKRALCEQAEALKDSTDWKETSDKLVALQKQWKEVGSVSRKYSEEIWKRFQTACDYFFDQKKSVVSDQREVENKNLTAKKEVIEKIEKFEMLSTEAESLAAVRALIAEFNAIGYVPFKDKDKIYKKFRAAVDKQFDALHVDVSNRRLDVFRTNLKDMETKGEGKLLDERRKLMRVYENLKSEIATSENNIGFFSAKSAKSAGLLKDMERKIASLKEELKMVEAKIGLIDEKL